ncbi:MAG: hypothetical protein RR053_01125 [Evtepia sp.]
MSIEAISEVNKVESDIQGKKLAASAQAKQIVGDAERAGQLLLESSRHDAETEVKALMAQAEEQASTLTATVFADTKKSCNALCKSAEQRLKPAAELIVKRIVSVSWRL